MSEIISLTDRQIFEIDFETTEEEYDGIYEGGCLCGYYEYNLKGIGYIVIGTHCRKVSECPNGMEWYVDEEIKVFNNSIVDYGGIPSNEDLEQDDNLEIIGILDEYSTKEVRDIVRKSIIKYHSWNNTDEYGKQVDYSIEPIDAESEVFTSNYDYKRAYETVLGYLVNLEASCSNCGSNEASCGDCKKGRQMWTFNHELIDDIDQIEKFKVKKTQ